MGRLVASRLMDETSVAVHAPQGTSKIDEHPCIVVQVRSFGVDYIAESEIITTSKNDIVYNSFKFRTRISVARVRIVLLCLEIAVDYTLNVRTVWVVSQRQDRVYHNLRVDVRSIESVSLGSISAHHMRTAQMTPEIILYDCKTYNLRQQSRFYSVEVSQALVARLTRVRFTVGPLLFYNFLSFSWLVANARLHTNRTEEQTIFRLQLLEFKLRTTLATIGAGAAAKGEKRWLAAHQAINEHLAETVALPLLLPNLRYQSIISIVT